MRISESMLRKIIREEVESMNEIDPATADAVTAGFTSALGLSPLAKEMIALAIALAGGFAATKKMYPGLQQIARKLGLSADEIEQEEEKLKNNPGSINEDEMTAAAGLIGSDITQAMLGLAAAFGAFGVAKVASGSVANLMRLTKQEIEDTAKVMKNMLKPNEKTAEDLESEMLGKPGKF